MANNLLRNLRISFLIFCVLAAGLGLTRLASAQAPELQQKVAELKEAVAQNKQLLAQYTWVETVTISLKSEQKKQEHFQVHLGPDGKPQKTSLDAPTNNEPSGGRLKRHIVEKKKEEYEEYADQIKDLIKQYLPPEKDLIEQARQSGNIMVGQQPGVQGQYRVVISNYVKHGDNMTIVMDPAQKNIVSLTIASYLSDPSDAVNVTAEFSGMPGGPNHVSSETINGESKHLTVAIQNSNYQHL